MHQADPAREACHGVTLERSACKRRNFARQDMRVHFELCHLVVPLQNFATPEGLHLSRVRPQRNTGIHASGSEPRKRTGAQCSGKSTDCWSFDNSAFLVTIWQSQLKITPVFESVIRTIRTCSDRVSFDMSLQGLLLAAFAMVRQRVCKELAAA